MGLRVQSKRSLVFFWSYLRCLYSDRAWRTNWHCHYCMSSASSSAGRRIDIRIHVAPLTCIIFTTSRFSLMLDACRHHTFSQTVMTAMTAWEFVSGLLSTSFVEASRVGCLFDSPLPTISTLKHRLPFDYHDEERFEGTLRWELWSKICQGKNVNCLLPEIVLSTSLLAFSKWSNCPSSTYRRSHCVQVQETPRWGHISTRDRKEIKCTKTYMHTSCKVSIRMDS